MNINNTEIERKFLITMPAEEFLRCCDASEITQTYLKSESGVSARVRRRGKNGSWTYTHTVKRHISDMKREELEREISLQEYEELLKTADRGRNVIIKKRFCHKYKGLLFEIDLYPFWEHTAVMEVELEYEEQPVEFPPETEIIREVTADKRYTNASMAKAIPPEA